MKAFLFWLISKDSLNSLIEEIAVNQHTKKQWESRNKMI